jgi:hypothetical protein
MAKKAEAKAEKEEAGASKDEQIGFHKGALSTLAKERQEMLKILSIVEQLMHMHIKALKELGVDLEAQAKEMQGKAAKKDNKPIEDLLK